MKSRWNELHAAAFGQDDLAICVYATRLLGADESLVLHGGGSTSVKMTSRDFFGRDVEAVWVSRGDEDLSAVKQTGFSPLRLEETKMLAACAAISDSDIEIQLGALLLDASAPAPSGSAILHAILPFKYVCHTHSDALVTLSNTPNGERLIRENFPDCLALPYITPGRALTEQVINALQAHDIRQYKGIILQHHGVLTYADNARTAYENMIALADRAEQHIATHVSARIAPAGTAADVGAGTGTVDLLHLARIRRVVSRARGSAQIAVLNASPAALAYASREDVADISTRGPITPNHVIHTKRSAAICDANPGHEDSTIQSFADDYRRYFSAHDDGTHTMNDPAPRWAVWKKTGTLAFGSSLDACKRITDIVRHTVWAIQTGESLGAWQALPEDDIFAFEYGNREGTDAKQAAGLPKIHLGQVAIVTGAAGGIGRATAERLHADGAVVVGLDINPAVIERLSAPGLSGIQCDLTDETALKKAIDDVVSQYGGLDIIVANAGIFKSGETIDALGDSWDRHMAINLTATQRFFKHAIPYLKLGVEASIIVIGSRNATAPGAGAAAYSVSKAGVTQLARVAALELAPHGVRVNILHPDAVFDTELWTQEALEKSAARYGMSVAEYKTKNLLHREIKSTDIAALVSTVAGPAFCATTGAQIPVDGGSDRVI
ncbi:MAG: SDR family oxidoreductase [Verrucomicrobia bacterium]|nr:SDR family oxidoreductase [Verrucomicrobiota bacterium]